MKTNREILQEDLLTRIRMDRREDTAEGFNSLALRLFQYQYDHCLPYRRLCRETGRIPGEIGRWEEIPPVPVTAFKWLEVSCRPTSEAVAVFRSSGTTQGTQRRSHHFLFDLRIAEASILTSFERHLLPEGKRMRTVILTPSPEEMPDSSLPFMMGVVKKVWGTAGSAYYLRDGRIQIQPLIEALQESNEPLLLLGTSLSFVHFLGTLQTMGLRLSLPVGSRLMDTGGFKGKVRESSREDLDVLYQKHLGLDPAFCVNEYGMAEMSSQFYDRIAGSTGPRHFNPPPQVRTAILDPVSLTPVQAGETGLLCHYDLANLDSVFALLTEDLGRELEGGFELLGRAAGAESRGCSLLIDSLLQERS